MYIADDLYRVSLFFHILYHFTSKQQMLKLLYVCTMSKYELLLLRQRSWILLDSFFLLCW